MRVAANRINKDNGSIEARDLGAGVFREIRDNEDNTVGATVGDALHPSGRGEFTAAGCTDNEVDAGGRRLELRATHEVCSPLGVETGDDDVDQSRVESVLRASFVARIRHDLLDASSSCVRNARTVVQHLRNGGD